MRIELAQIAAAALARSEGPYFQRLPPVTRLDYDNSILAADKW